ncbi:hypothetical protein MNBD_CHLOROFLEXI01-2095 [hydrothermal vent metagenome]|uniref:DUF2281 domain-containing protein n=1 Tax=hydrothermal vent metagenome TaxID=652676 RepID=A0A3B0V3K5_9ZZZZ
MRYAPVVEKIQTLPEPLLREVDDFVDFLLARYMPTTQSIENDLPATLMSRFAAAGGGFEWLNDLAEDIYNDDDGEPV